MSTSSTPAACHSGLPLSRPAGCSSSPAPRPPSFGSPTLVDETLEPARSQHYPARRCRRHRHPHPGTRCEVTRSAGIARERGAWVVFGGVHASLYPDEAFELGSAHAVVRGDGDLAWARCSPATASIPVRNALYEGGRLEADQFKEARWDLLCRKANICGVPCRQPAAVPSTALSAPSGEPMVKDPASVPTSRSFERLSSSDAAASVS